MNIEIAWWGGVVTRAVITVGVIEYLKGYLGKWLIPSWVLRLALLLASFGVAAVGYATWDRVVTAGLAITAVAEMGYPVLIKLPEAAIDALKKKLAL